MSYKVLEWDNFYYDMSILSRGNSRMVAMHLTEINRNNAL
jgi:hypothetical protein